MGIRSAVTVLSLIALASTSARAQAPVSPLHGALDPGPHAVGFRILHVVDRARPELPATRADGSTETGERGRRLQIHLWYPAVPSAAPPLTAREYALAEAPPQDAAGREQRLAGLRRFMEQFGPVGDADWSGLLATPLLARRDAPHAAGRFPLILGELRPFSTTVTNEHLASHGYVVAMVYGESAPPFTDPGAALEVAVRDMEFAVPVLRGEPFVDPVRLATLGFSGSGFAQILFAMRHPDVRAVCDLESAIFDDRMMWPLHRGWGYDVSALRTPFLHTYGVPLSQRESRIADFEAMRYATRYRYLVDAPGLHHWDFATEGMAASAVLRNRGADGPRLQLAFETTNRYVRTFYDAHLKGDGAALAFLRREPEANGVAAGLVTMRSLPAIEPAITIDELRTSILQGGAAAALQIFDEGRRRDPLAATPGDEAQLNRVAYSILNEGRSDEAMALFRKILEMYPGSANAHDSLAEALEARGDRAEALEVSRRGLDALGREELTPARRAQLRQLLEDRVRRLGG